MRLSHPEAPQRIAATLKASLKETSFRVPVTGPRDASAPRETAPAYQLELESEEHGAPLVVLLWPSLDRVDVRLGKSSWTLKGVDSVELYADVEVLFRREEPPALLFVSLRGRVALIA
jgi:hypothetical protein